MTLERFFQSPPASVIIIIICFAIIAELWLRPTRSLLEASKKLFGPTNFLWFQRIGAGIIILLWSAQPFAARVILLLITVIIILLLATKKDKLW